MTGKGGHDEGQVAAVTQQKKCMVEIAFIGPKGDLQMKLKKPSTLLFLAKGVTVTQDQDGTMWVRPERNAGKSQNDRK
jgi:hypothetical protein